MTTTLLIETITTPISATVSRGSITLQVDEVVRGRCIQTDEFELPDAEFAF